MIISSQALRGVTVAFNTLFNKAFSGVKPTYEQIAMVVPSTTESETYAWLGDIPGMREWLGDREIKNLTESDYTIKNKDFELTVGVPRNAIEDDKIGLYTPSIQMLAESAAQHPDTLTYKLVGDGFAAKCYDGKSFFAEDHPVGKKAVSNKLTAPLSLASYTQARMMMMSLQNAKGIPLALVPDRLLVPPALEAEARKILMAEYIDGTTNTMRGTAELHVEPHLASTTAWYLLCTARPIKPIIYQRRKDVKFVSLTAENDTNVFMQKNYLYGADSRGNVGFGLWQMAVGSTGVG